MRHSLSCTRRARRIALLITLSQLYISAATLEAKLSRVDARRIGSGSQILGSSDVQQARRALPRAKSEPSPHAAESRLVRHLVHISAQHAHAVI